MRRIVIPFVATIMLVWGLLMLPNIASSATTQPDDSPVAERLLSAASTGANCEPLTLDLYYILDLSSSMGQLYEKGSDHNKLDAAKQAISETNLLIDSWDNGSRMGLITFYGGQNGVGNPPTYEVIVTNQLAFRPLWGGLTDDLDDFNDKLSPLSANGSTPTSHALNDSLSEMSLDHEVGHLPVFILLSDGVPTISSERFSFNDADVQAVDVRDGAGGFRSIEDIRLDGGPASGYPGYFNGEPLADVMVAINDIMESRPDFTYHAIGIQGQKNNAFNSGILEYLAFMGPGLFAEPDNQSALLAALSEAVIQSACSTVTDDSQWLTPEGGTLKFNSMPVTLKAPPGAVKEPVLVTLHPIRPGAGHSISQIFELAAHNEDKEAISNFERPVLLSVQLQNSFSSAKDKLYRWDDGRWVELKSDERVSRGTVTGKTSLLGIFGVGQ